MGVYMPNMALPKSCKKCELFRYEVSLDRIRCRVTGSEAMSWDLGEWNKETPRRMDDCPLIEVPVPHGRLADCDAVEECLKEVTDGETKDYAMMLLDWAVSKRTVIEREDE